MDTPGYGCMDTVGCHRLWLVTIGYNGCWLKWVMAGYSRLQLALSPGHAHIFNVARRIGGGLGTRLVDLLNSDYQYRQYYSLGLIVIINSHVAVQSTASKELSG